MRLASLSLFPLALACLIFTTGAAWPAGLVAAGGLPDNGYLIMIGAIVLISGGALGGFVNLLKVLEHFRLKRQAELAGQKAEMAGHNSGLVSRHTLDEELNRVYQRIEERDKRLENKIDDLTSTSQKLAENVASALTAIRYLSEQQKGGPRVKA